MEWLMFIVAVVGVCCLLLWFRYCQRDAWKSVADEMHLNYISGGFFSDPSLYGHHLGIDVTVQILDLGHGRNDRKMFTVFEAELASLGAADLEMHCEGFLPKLMTGKVFSGGGMRVGDPELDEAFVIQGSDKARVRELLGDRQVRRQMLAGLKISSSFRVEDGKVYVRKRGRTGNPDALRDRINAVVAAANAIEDAWAVVLVDQSEVDQSEVDHPQVAEPTTGSW